MLESYKEIFSLEEHIFIVGGQAVNIWAEHYRAKGIPGLELHLPFVSDDIDLYGDKELLKKVGQLYGLKPTVAAKGAPSPSVGIIELADEGTIEVLRPVCGLKGIKDGDWNNIELHGKKVKVMSIPVLLKAKLANLKNLDQSKRQDKKHVKMLCICVKAQVYELITSILTPGQDKPVLKYLEHLLQVYIKYKPILANHNIVLASLFPDEPDDIKSTKIKNFFNKRLKNR